MTANIKIEKYFKETLDVFRDFTEGNGSFDNIERAAERIIDCIRGGGKILVFGNGGSAADSQHFAAEMVVRFKKERKAFPCIALTCDSSVLTANSNDYGFETIFSRQIEALGSKGDICLAISTSGNSPNVLMAAETALSKGLGVIALTGSDGGSLADIADISIFVTAGDTAKIQQVHITVIHVLCELIEESVFCDAEQ